MLLKNKTNRYLDDLLNIDNEYLEQMVNTIYPIELQLINQVPQTQKRRFWIKNYH